MQAGISQTAILHVFVLVGPRHGLSVQSVAGKKERGRNLSRIVAREIEIEGDQINLYCDLLPRCLPTSAQTWL